MKMQFETRLEAIDWIANYTDDEGWFEVLREQLNYNYIYSNKFFLEINEEADLGQVVWLNRAK